MVRDMLASDDNALVCHGLPLPNEARSTDRAERTRYTPGQGKTANLQEMNSANLAVVDEKNTHWNNSMMGPDNSGPPAISNQNGISSSFQTRSPYPGASGA